jgi:hypothetical protein
MTFELTHACHDRAVVLAPGLFRSVARGGREGRPLTLQYAYGAGMMLHFAAPSLLGADDLRGKRGDAPTWRVRRVPV